MKLRPTVDSLHGYALAWLACLMIAANISSADDVLERGEIVYASACAVCHGLEGAGDPSAYEDPLIGDLSIGELAAVIADTMPEDDPGTCVAEDAEAVAAYIHEAFYSEAARLRNRPPRVELTRLTADQLRQSIADLYAKFEGLPRRPGMGGQQDAKPGLTGEYFSATNRKKEARKFERIDAQLNFDFGRESPGEGIEANEFCIYWRGGIIAEVTGRYEIIVRSSCSFTCNLGNYERELIDNHVQSGDKTEFRVPIVLTAGRVYPFDLELIQRNRKTEIPPANVSLSWVPPRGVEQIIPARNLTSEWTPAAYSLQTQLPPDDRSYGYERGIAVNRQWDESVTQAALEFAQIAAEESWPKYQRRHREDNDEGRAKLKGFLAEIVQTAFRTSSLDDETRDLYIDRQIAEEADDADAIKRVLLLSLKSPRFLYPDLASDSPSQQAASQVALALYDSLPTDDWLAKAVRNNEFSTADAIRNYVRGNLDDYRVRAKTRAMLHEWLNLGHTGEITKDSEQFPGFDEALMSDLRNSLDLFIDEVVWGESGDFRQFFQANWRYTNSRLASFYGDEWTTSEVADDSGFSRTAPKPEEPGMGLLNHPLLMGSFAYHNASSPIHRGVFLIRFLLGRSLQPPQEAFSPLSPDLHPDLTTRERVALQTSPDNCQVCHTRINGLGFTLENYDAAGRFRSEEKGRAIDVAGSYTTLSEDNLVFSGPADLAEYLSDGDDPQRAFVSRAFQYFVKQPPAAFGADTLDVLLVKFRESNFNIRELIVEIVVVAGLPRSTQNS